jgi:hypothetical protein
MLIWLIRLILLLDLHHLRGWSSLWRSLQLVAIAVSRTRAGPTLLPARVVIRKWHKCLSFLGVLTLNICLQLIVFRFHIFIRILIDLFGFLRRWLWLRLMGLLALAKVLYCPWALRRLQPCHLTVLLLRHVEVCLLLIMAWFAWKASFWLEQLRQGLKIRLFVILFMTNLL